MDELQTQVYQLSALSDKLLDILTNAGVRILLSLVIYVAGRILIKWVLKLFDKMESVSRIDSTARTYIRNCLKIVMYVILAVSIIAELGVQMSSIIAVIASCGMAIGLGLQGALTNVAGGLILLIFRPFVVGDVINVGGTEGYVKSINLMYTVIDTWDNKAVSIPNGNLMNSSITNNTAENLRRVDLAFNIAGDEPINKVRSTIMKVIINMDDALAKPAPEVQPVETVPGGLKYAIRVWVETPKYWEVFNGLMNSIPQALNAADIRMAATPVKVKTD